MMHGFELINNFGMQVEEFIIFRKGKDEGEEKAKGAKILFPNKE